MSVRARYRLNNDHPLSGRISGLLWQLSSCQHLAQAVGTSLSALNTSHAGMSIQHNSQLQLVIMRRPLVVD
jgi:hypothetical protein